MDDTPETARDLAAYTALVDLWKQENPIKTTKLQVLLTVNGGLLTVVELSGGLGSKNVPLYLAGAVLSLVWTLSIGRTALFQKVWQIKMTAIASKYPNDPRFQAANPDDAIHLAPRWLRAIGGVSSKYYLLGAPILCFFGWSAVALFTLLTP